MSGKTLGRSKKERSGKAKAGGKSEARRSGPARQASSGAKPPQPRSAVVVRPILGLERDEAMAVARLYHEAFPAAQRVADAALIQLVPRGLNEPGGWLFHLAERRLEALPQERSPRPRAASASAEIIGFGVGLHVSPLHLAYVAYLAVRPDWRGRGAGTALFRSLVNMWKEARPSPPRWVFLEVERPELAADNKEREQRLRRIHFYERFGCRQIQADFQAPPLGPRLPVVPYRILVLPFPDADLGKAALRVAIADIYREVYKLKEDHPLVTNCLNTLEA